MKLYIRHPMILIFLLFSLNASSENISSSRAMHELSKLAGLWKVQDSDSAFRIQFELTANNTVLVESWLAEGKSSSLTLYHQDGKDLIATHYCPQGNQPRLKMLEQSTEKHLKFTLFDISNLKSNEHAHQSYLSFNMLDDGKIIRSEKYTHGETVNSDEIVLVKVN